MTYCSKLVLALTAGILLFPFVAGAVDYSCAASSVPTLVRSEGTAERMGDIRLDCNGTPLGVIVANVRLTLSVNIASRVLAEGPPKVTEALLLLGGGAGGWHGYGASNQNVFQGVRISDTEIEWQGVTLAPSGGPAVQQIRLTNVRANVQGIPESAQVFAVINIISATPFPLFNFQQTVATTRRGAQFSVPSGSTGICEGTSLTLRFAEDYGSAFLPVGDADVENTTLGGGYWNESGFNPTPLAEGSLVGLASIGQATQGTRLLAEFTGFKGRLELSVPNLIVLSSSGMSLAVVTGHDSNGGGGSLATSPGTTVLPMSKRGVMAVYEVTSCTSGECYALQQNVDVPVGVVRGHGPVNRLLGNLMVKGGLGPLSTLTTARILAFTDTGTEVDLSCK